ncbi:MAG: hypothetical protein ACLFPO_02990 [Spirochaetaceae bacterium]
MSRAAAAAVCLLLSGLPSPQVSAQRIELDRSPPHVIIPAPEPFSLSAYDALHARAMMYRVGFVQLWYGNGAPETVRVREVEALRIGFEEGLPTGHRARYDLRLNGRPVDWDHTYIEYDGRMVSLRLLFTYRNQYPPDDLEYTGNDYTW